MWDEGKGSYGDKLMFSGGINFGMTPVFGAFFWRCFATSRSV